MLLAIAAQTQGAFWISRHIEMHDLSTVMADDEKAVQNTKRQRWDGEEVHRSVGRAIVFDER